MQKTKFMYSKHDFIFVCDGPRSKRNFFYVCVFLLFWVRLIFSMVVAEWKMYFTHAWIEKERERESEHETDKHMYPHTHVIRITNSWCHSMHAMHKNALRKRRKWQGTWDKHIDVSKVGERVGGGDMMVRLRKKNRVSNRRRKKHR